jgi:16S rRNA (cytidine1402-2'-O)-methyltransferase
MRPSNNDSFPTDSAKQSAGTLHLIPVGLSDSPIDQWLPREAQAQAAQLDHFIAENAKTARAFLKLLDLKQPLQSINIQTLSDKIDAATLTQWLAPLEKGDNMGLVSEAGCPAVADPGARVVTLAHELGLTVKPWVGPSSILLGLMASGLDGQRFTFHGYAPVKPDARAKQLKQWEQLSARQQQTQILIETPYRNAALFQTLIETLAPKTRLCIARDVTGSHEWIQTHQVASWRQKVTPELASWPTLFLFQA